MDGAMVVSYKVLCEGDLNNSITLEELLLNEKILKLIQSEFAKGHRNIDVKANKSSSAIEIATKKEIQTIEVSKNDYADLLVLAEDDATTKKLFKKDCSRIELVDIKTL